MNRLKAVLAPASPATARSRRAVVGLSALLAGLACAGSFAIAAQRQPVIVEAPAERPVGERAAAPAAAPTVLPERVAAAVASERPERAPAPAMTGTQAAPVTVPQPYKVEESRSSAAVGQSSEITRVTWAAYPTPMFPAEAARNGVDSGTVTLSCLVEADGSASDCTLVSETPEGQGFGEAALAAMERARFSATVMETATPGARARFTIRFRMAA